MWGNWALLYFDGVERHRGLLREAATRRGQRLVSEEGKPGLSVYYGVMEWARQREAPTDVRPAFTARERRRLVLLRWRIRLGLLVD